MNVPLYAVFFPFPIGSSAWLFPFGCLQTIGLDLSFFDLLLVGATFAFFFPQLHVWVFSFLSRD